MWEAATSISEVSRWPAPHSAATSSAATIMYATAARGCRPPGSGITGTPSARAISARRPPVLTTVRLAPSAPADS
jgi:hypothetical protein